VFQLGCITKRLNQIAARGNHRSDPVGLR
jgi:hypothetical protein